MDTGSITQCDSNKRGRKRVDNDMNKHTQTTRRGRPAWIAVAVAAVAAMLLMAGPASAITYTLDQGNTSSPGISAYDTYGPYGTVTVTWVDNTHANIDLESSTGTTNPSSGYYFLFGDGGTIGLNTNGTVSVGTITRVGGIGSSTPTSGGAGNEDGFGNFNFSINNGSGAADAVAGLQFTLTNTSGTWSSDADVLTPNGSGNVVAAHVFVYAQAPTTTNHSAVATGYANGNVAATPEPASFAMAGTAVVTLAGLALRRRLRS
jgi:hypothetical protein